MEMKSLTIGDNIYDLPRGGGDWNVNDPAADDYIKNRPFYKGEENITILIPETTISVIEGDVSLNVEDGGVAWNIAKDNIGKIVKIQYNDVIEYGLIEIDIEAANSCNIYAPYSHIYMNNIGYTISINALDAANVVFHALIDNTEINKISSEYLPIPSIEGTGTSSIILNGSLSECKADGPFSVAEGSRTTASRYYGHAEGYNTTASGFASHSEGNSPIASGNCSHAEGQDTTASGSRAHAEGYKTKASGNSSHAEGYSTIASGTYAHAEGNSTTASGGYAHAEGASTTAAESSSHAEGSNTIASGAYSHAEGFYTTASGENSHAEGLSTIANHKSQHVFGEYNIADPSSETANKRGNYVEIVGNGTSYKAKHNARTLDWSGNEALQGSLTLGVGTADETTVTAAQLKALLAMLQS